MSFNINMTITGIQQAQAGNARMIAALRPISALGRAILYGLTAAQRYAVSITHVDTGSLRAAHRMRVEGAGTTGRVYIDQAAVNPRSRTRPAEYGIYEEARGGSHAFYRRTVDEAGPGIATGMYNVLRGAF